MRLVGLGLIGALGLVTAAASANAAPTVGDLGSQNPNIIVAAGGCGFGLHPNRWGDCVPNRYGEYRMNPSYGLRTAVADIMKHTAMTPTTNEKGVPAHAAG